MDIDNAPGLGEFLQTRRARVTPEQAGLPATTGRRRITGLRREEVALLAGVSIEYYRRLEQGKQHRPGPAVLEAVARVLRLDEDERRHLFELAKAPRDVAEPGTAPQRVLRPDVLRMLEIVDPCPAYVLSRANDLLAANTRGLRLLPGIEEWPGPRRNTARYTFLHPAARRLYGNWEDVAAATVAHLRAAAGRYPDAPDVTGVVGELIVKSEEFATLWQRYEVRNRTNGRKHFTHPATGTMMLSYEAYEVARTDGHRLIVYQAEPDSPDHDAMLLLGHADASCATGGQRPM
ncbi:helix-turn-helix transcriptional regulator [Streptomyces griseocarneus]|uniref:helix-turn-helix transcriptional regulator n=1 Tax=Streptomyces griseocarneus TaxID=51201 RepID=UPI0019C5DF15|nr:helix-turn-helix transcriptional regulator [Streptomyces griseocarneus]MBZ6475270.1 helix-turn-helix transcriptional regulator [Streptomyces griseocarneus]GHG74266.1 transcriptional regulator [Streptomyces griseocarneus]